MSDTCYFPFRRHSIAEEEDRRAVMEPWAKSSCPRGTKNLSVRNAEVAHVLCGSGGPRVGDPNMSRGQRLVVNACFNQRLTSIWTQGMPAQDVSSSVDLLGRCQGLGQHNRDIIRYPYIDRDVSVLTYPDPYGL